MAGLFDVIKYEGDNSTFIWKHPREDFHLFSQLIVHENQEAVFFMNGQALDLFGPGRYTLKTQNLPLAGQVLNLVTGGISPFHCEVYFINKSDQMSIKWGTDSRVQYMEPVYQFPLLIGASGEMSLRVSDSRRLLVRLVGTEKDLSQKRLTVFFRACLMTRVKAYIAQSMKQQGINIFEIDEHLVQFSDSLKEQLMPDFAAYGISLEHFFVTKVIKPDGELQYEKFKELHFRQYADIAEAKLRQKTEMIYAQTEAQKTVMDSAARASKRVQEGYTYQQERGFGIADTAARNEAAGEFANMGIGLGMMAGVGSMVGGMTNGLVKEAVDSAETKPAVRFCENCGVKLAASAAFCEECGAGVFAAACNRCKRCGYLFERPGKFCPKCGEKRRDINEEDNNRRWDRL